MSTQTADPVLVPVPSDEDMAAEPARLIANLTKLKNALVMIVAVAGVVIAPELSENLDTLIQSGVAVSYGIYAIYQAHRQGESTREAVYSPDTAAAIARASQADVVPGDPRYASPATGAGGRQPTGRA